MIIFIRKIPAATKASELIDFVGPALKGGLFRKSGRITAVKILAVQDKRLNTLEFHGLVSVEPDAVGIRAIRKLKGSRFKGKLIIVRQYFIRDWHKDPRQNPRRVVDKNILDRRINDRRRGNDLEIIKDISEQFSSSGDFVRKSP